MLARGRQEVTYLDHPYGSVLLLCGHPRTARSWTAICCAGLLIPSLQSEHGFTSECLAKTGTWHTCLQRANGCLSCFRWHLRHYETHWNLTWHGFTFTEISAFKNLLEEKKEKESKKKKVKAVIIPPGPHWLKEHLNDSQVIGDWVKTHRGPYFNDLSTRC